MNIFEQALNIFCDAWYSDKLNLPIIQDIFCDTRILINNKTYTTYNVDNTMILYGHFPSGFYFAYNIRTKITFTPDDLGVITLTRHHYNNNNIDTLYKTNNFKDFLSIFNRKDEQPWEEIIEKLLFKLV